MAFRNAGVARIVFLRDPDLRLAAPPFPTVDTIDVAPAVVRIVLEGASGTNPHVSAASRRAHLFGPGYTDGDVARVYVDELRGYMFKHRQEWVTAFERSRPDRAQVDWNVVWRHLVTNTAVHESWHAATHSHAHNVTDIGSVMYGNAADNVLLLGTEWLPFTRGHRTRLEEIFGWK